MGPVGLQAGRKGAGDEQERGNPRPPPSIPMAHVGLRRFSAQTGRWRRLPLLLSPGTGEMGARTPQLLGCL